MRAEDPGLILRSQSPILVLSPRPPVLVSLAGDQVHVLQCGRVGHDPRRGRARGAWLRHGWFRYLSGGKAASRTPTTSGRCCGSPRPRRSARRGRPGDPTVLVPVTALAGPVDWPADFWSVAQPALRGRVDYSDPARYDLAGWQGDDARHNARLFVASVYEKPTPFTGQAVAAPTFAPAAPPPTAAPARAPGYGAPTNQPGLWQPGTSAPGGSPLGRRPTPIPGLSGHASCARPRAGGLHPSGPIRRL